MAQAKSHKKEELASSQVDAQSPDLERSALLLSAKKTSYTKDPGREEKDAEVGGKELDEELEAAFCPTSGKGHFEFLDVTRIVCVALVAVDHGNGAYSDWNASFGQDWVLQFLFLVCGVCFGMSKRPFFGYQVRLATYAVVGILINWAAWVLKGDDWKSNFFGVVFQFWFIVGVMANAAVLLPFKWYLDRVLEKARLKAQEPKEDRASEDPWDIEHRRRSTLQMTLVIIGGGVLGFVVVFKVVIKPFFLIVAPLCVKLTVAMGPSGIGWGLPSSEAEAIDWCSRIATYLMLSVSNLYLLVVCPMAFERPYLTGWLIIANTYFFRTFFYRSADERPFHALDLMTIALVVYKIGLLHRRRIGMYVHRYWFLVVGLCTLLWIPGTQGRLDMFPPRDLDTRARYNLIEGIFVTCWLVAGERFVSPKIFTEDRMGFMGDWALVVFLAHKAIHIAVPSPISWVLLLALAPACYLWRRHTEK